MDADSARDRHAGPTRAAPGPCAAGASRAQLARAVRDRRLTAQGAALLQRTAGNRSVTRLLARAGDEHRPMQGPSPDDPKPDKVELSPSGHRFVWDPFDHTGTIFMPQTGQPNPGGAIQIVWTEATEDANAKLPNHGVERVTSLSPLRAQVLERLRVKQGTYQETEDQRKARVAAASGTLCYAFTAEVTSLLESSAADEAANSIVGMNPRLEAIRAGRGGAFHTLDDRPEGPQPGDIVSYGSVKRKPAKGERRTANFEERSHVGVFKSKRRAGSDWIWTVVDGGQSLGKSRQAIWERTRLYTEEELDVSIPKTFAQQNVYKEVDVPIPGSGATKKEKRLVTEKGAITNYEPAPVTKRCGVLKSSLADSGQSDGDKLLRGWLDIDEYYGTAKAESLSLDGVNSSVFVGSSDAARKSAAAAGTLATSP